ncbi:MAG TPA: phosphoglycerate kinase [Ignavibacteria bacterium]|nr:phosphoglycerate kinase [Bacteroidota bacterium]HRI84188.1 phosphoglycerate kinase [Ignavibacteria bacterium]HRJ98341.1 phosphoglycerate kinase [Ignavibacteria bacterium]
MSSNKLTLQDLIDKNEIKYKRVLVRVDFNVPIDENGIITDDNRILQSLPTIKAIIKNGGKCILMSHLGRPKGEKNPKYTLSAIAGYLSNVLNFPVLFSDDCISENNSEVIDEMRGGDVLLLENLRYYKEEEKNDPGFAEKLAAYGEIYINDAFGTAHRAHASTEGVTHFIKTCAAGYLMEKELKYLSSAISNPARPLCAILGGSKISGKIDVLENLLGSADTILIGGGMMFTFYKAMGYNIGKSILEEDRVGLAKEIIEKANDSKTKLLLPADVLMAEKFEQGSKTVTVKADGITSEYNNWTGVDIGPETIKIYSGEILKSKTIVWNGPMGVFEIDDFANGTMQIAKALADATAKGAVSIIGGGDSASAVAKAGLEKKISHVSTGGGASLEFLEGKKLPGVEALSEK